jgi:hypothetical protein
MVKVIYFCASISIMSSDEEATFTPLSDGRIFGQIAQKVPKICLTNKFEAVKKFAKSGRK